jgi:hypothetical protein
LAVIISFRGKMSVPSIKLLAHTAELKRCKALRTHDNRSSAHDLGDVKCD